MAFWNAIPVVGGIINNVIGLVDEVVEDKDEANKLKAQLTEVFNKSDMVKFTEQIKAQTSIITTEAKSQSWIARNWRPLIMLLFGIIIANNYVIYPYLNLIFDTGALLEVPPQMWQLLKLGIGGYIVGRSAEKGLSIWKDKK